jgi:hypothetical protein
MDRLCFVTTIPPGRSLMDLYLLITSIREFGGKLADVPIWVCVPQGEGKNPGRAWDHFRQLDVRQLTFPGDEAACRFPFGIRVQAGAVAERELRGRTELLAWLDNDTILLNEPAEFLLAPDKVLGYRPVHHRLLGIPRGEELDQFWELIYHECQAIPRQDDYMVTHVGEQIRPYFNAGSFVIRPEAGLLERWWETFQPQFQNPAFLPFYQQDDLYTIFMHQAIFTGVLLAALDPAARQELSPRVNYPLHLHQEIPLDLRAKTINDLITVRCESILSQPGWQGQLPIREPLLGWLENQLELIENFGADK